MQKALNMFIDAREESVRTDYEYDLCIVGAGAAGIALALEFINEPIRICLLESGDFEYDKKTQNLYRGESVGRACDPLDVSRLRYFGGTTNHWAGYCMPLSSDSFEARSWVPYSGWPISKKEVAPYYDRARKLLGLPDLGWNPDQGWSVADWAQQFGDPLLDVEFPGFNHNALVIKPVRMGIVFRKALADAKNIDIFLNTNVVDIEAQETGDSVKCIHAQTLNRRKLDFTARYFIIAAGGIEKVRLLLASNSVHKTGLGNHNGLVGRFFADHVNVMPGYLQPINQGINLNLYQARALGGAQAVVWHEISPEQQREFQLVPASVRLMAKHAGVQNKGGQSLRAIKSDLLQGRIPDDLGVHIANAIADIEPVSTFAAKRLWYGSKPISKVGYELSVAPAPNPESRVTLSEEKDVLGMPRAKLDWKLSDIDFRTIQWAAENFSAAAAASGLGRSKLAVDDVSLRESVQHTRHHMCTTRMADDPKSGVVDRNCKVFGLDNVYIAGSSVFSTSGWGSPTMLIIALAQRIADRLKQELK